MDAEIAAMLTPANAPKIDYTQNPPVPMNTSIFWTEPAFLPAESSRDRVERVATVTLFSYEVQGNQ
jgi:hypothetical protein